MEHKIELKNIEKSYDNEPPVIKNLNLNIEEGSFTVLLGPSGCGKSTTLRMIAGLEQETKGDILIHGRSMKDVKPGDRGIAMVFQNYALYPTMTVKGNIEFGLKNSKVPKEEREKRIQEVSKSVGLEEYLNRKPGALSGGQRQRVALARAMVKHPEVFLMDEPLSNLDAKLRTQLRSDLIELHNKLKATFIYVTHDQIEAMSMGTHIVLLNKGKIMQQGSPWEIYHNPDNVFTAQFIGTPPMNIMKTQEINYEHTSFAEAAYMGFRPEYGVILQDGKLPEEKGLVMKGKVITHEMLGTETLYKIDTPHGRIQVKLFDDSQAVDGQVSLFVPHEKILYFDAQEQRLR
ncbi:MAG: ABC transporter ATP-binding protein [Lachnospiraceae bacterium]|nr:ABC transporter ATP-binding protein [Lachnospiraceae bacterium]